MTPGQGSMFDAAGQPEAAVLTRPVQPTADVAAYLDPDEAQQAAHEAIDRAGAHAAPDWLAEAYRTVKVLAASHLGAEGFTSDDVWARLDGATHEPRALGAVMRSLAREGVIEPTAAYRPSVRTACHGRPVRVWQRKEAP